MEYGAIDFHTKHSQIRIVTADGTVVVERRIATRADQFAGVFGGRDRMRILLESSTESEWVATGLEGLGTRMAWQGEMRPGRTREPKDRSLATPAFPMLRRRSRSPPRARLEG